MRIPSSRNTRSETEAGASHIRSLPRAVLPGTESFANRVSPARIITKRSRPSAIATMRRRAILQSFGARKPKRFFGFFRPRIPGRKNLGLYVAAMNTDRPQPNSVPFSNYIVRFSAAARWIAGQFIDVLVMYRSERK